MSVLIGFLLAVGLTLLLIYPFLRSRMNTGASEYDQVEEAVDSREAIYQEMGALQLDYQLGHLSQEEYRTRMEGYRMEAAVKVRLQERILEELEALDEELEKEIEALRKALPSREGNDSS